MSSGKDKAIKFIDEAEVEKLRKAPKDLTYYKLTQPLRKGINRLFSTSANEEEIKIVLQSQNDQVKKNIKRIFRGEDGFFYAEVQDKCRLTYILSSKSLDFHKPLKKISEDNIIRKTVEEYLRNEEKNKKADHPKIEDFDSEEKWLEAIFKLGKGSCEERVKAVYNQLLGKGVKEDSLRIIEINKNHSILEVKNGKEWLSIDLGGLPAKKLYSNIGLDDAEKSGEDMFSMSAYYNLGNTSQATSQGGESTSLFAAKQTALAETQQKEEEINVNIQELRASIQSITNDSEKSGARKDEKKEAEEKIAALEQKQEQLKKELKEEEAALDVLQETSRILATSSGMIAKNIGLENLDTASLPSKTLIVSQDSEKIANHLIEKNNQRPIFYIQKFSDIDFALETLEINKDGSGNARKTKADALRKFLENPAIKSKKPLIIINWSNFTNSQKTSLNTLIDADGNRSVNGVKVGNEFQIVSLLNERSADPSFNSRHQSYFNIAVTKDAQDIVQLGADTKVIDVQGLSAKEILLGKFFLRNNQISWQKTEFINALEGQDKAVDPKNPKLKIINLSIEARKELEKIFALAKAQGYVDYYGYKIKIPKNLQIEYKEDQFDFIQFLNGNISIAKDADYTTTPRDAVIINTFLFDSLLHKKSVQDKVYSEESGLIQSHQGQTLKLLITSELTTVQLYCIFNEAKKYNCRLQLYLAPNVILPGPLRAMAFPESPISRERNSVKTQIFVTNNARQISDEIKGENSTVIDVEDSTYQSLIEDITFKTNDESFYDFEKIVSDILKKLRNGHNIILKGRFPEDLLKMLEPIITSKPPEFEAIGNNLKIVIEDKEITASQATYPALSWLGNNYKVQFRDREIKAQNIFTESRDASALDDRSVEKSKEFIEKRKTAFVSALGREPLISLIGTTGVGKSSFVRSLEKEESDKMVIYNDLSKIEEWISDGQPEPAVQIPRGYKKNEEGKYLNKEGQEFRPPSPTAQQLKSRANKNKYKIIFIDESNIENTNFSMFDELKKGGSRKITVNGKTYTLTDKHIVVFARNPLEYGGGRVKQGLFADGKTFEMHFEDFPAAYLYEELLKKAIFDKLSSADQAKIGLDNFKKFCQQKISEYQQINERLAQDPKSIKEQLTVRELQDQAIVYLTEKLVKKEDFQIKTASFVSTKATKAVEDALNSAISIKKLQRENKIPAQGLGINGVLLEGPAGIGKSELIKAVLNKRGIKDSREVADPTKEYCYYKIDAATIKVMSIKEIKALATRVLNEGNILWIDEINSCINNAELEKTLNTLLTGYNPETGEPLEKQGGQLISSVNSAALEGRDLVSPALKHRLRCPRVSSLREYTKEDMQTILTVWIDDKKEGESEKYKLDKLAEYCCDCFQNPSGFNLRTMRENLDKILPIYSKDRSKSPSASPTSPKIVLSRDEEQDKKNIGK